jgi:PAS domain S-box-containing protein
MSQREILTPFHLANESGYGQILQNTLAVIYVRDRQGRFIFANQRFLEAFDIPLKELLGKTCADLFPADIARQYEKNDRRVLDLREVMEFEETAPVQGQERTYISIKFPLFDSSGDVFALCGISTDITERKKKENLLYDVAVKLCSIPDESLFDDVVQYLSERLGVDFAMVGRVRPDSPWVQTVAACERGQRLESFDYPLDGTPCAEVIGREFYCVPCDLLQRYPGDNMLSHGGYESYAGYPLYDSQGAPLGLLAVTHRTPLRDISFIESILKIFSLRVAVALERQQVEAEKKAAEAERKQLARQLQQAQKMEAIGQLTGGIAHDFNNLLTGVMGYISLAQEQPACQHDPKLQRYLERAQAAGRKAGELIQQMLTFSRGEHGEPRAVQVSQLLPEFVTLMEASLPSSIEVQLHNDPGLPAVMVDPLHLEQVLMNLCINARDAMDGSGRLILRSRRLQCRHGVCESCQQSVHGDFIAISVGDSGSGIAPNVMERMFEPFYSTKDTGKGSGMGLAMVHGIVHEYGGHVLVESQAGKGSVFTVLLPVCAQAAAQLSAPTSTATPTRVLRGKVLVVDDQPVVSEFMQDLLQDWGLEVVVFNQPQPALAFAVAQGDTLLAAIVDYTMPRLTGLEWAQQVAQQQAGLPVLLYSGYREEIDSAAAARAGVRDILRKPIDEKQLFQWLRNLAETKSQR